MYLIEIKISTYYIININNDYYIGIIKKVKLFN